MNWKKALLLVLFIYITVTVSSQPVEEITNNNITLTLGYGAPMSNPRNIVARQFAEWVKDQSDGSITIVLYPAAMLGTDRQMAEAVSMGALDMSISSHGTIAAFEPKLAALELPFLFSSPEKVDIILDGPIGKELSADLPSKGIRILAYWENGLRQITNNKRPIETPSDFNGIKIRTPENKMTLDIFQSLGASPAPLASTELYMALSQGLFDAQENPITNIYAAKFGEVQAYVSITNHKYECCPMIISEGVWQELSSSQQDILAEGARKFAVVHRAMVRDNEAGLLEELQASGMVVNRPDVSSFREVTSIVYDKWAEILGWDLIDRIIAAAK